jgi:DHA1 family multidrug resistance protein-like MFS transporter
MAVKNGVLSDNMQQESPPPSPKPVLGSRATLLSIGVVLGLAELSYMLMNFSAMPVYLKFRMGYGETLITFIGTAFLFCEGVMKGPFGILGDRIGRKLLIIAGPLVSVITSLLTLLVPAEHWYLFVLLRILDGLGAAALWPSALVMMADLVPPERRSQAMSLFNVTYLMAVALGPLLGGAANDLTRYLSPNAVPERSSFYLISVLFLLTAAMAAWRIPNIRPLHESHPHEHEAGFSMSALVHSLKQIPHTLLMAFITFFGIGMCMLIIKLFAMQEFGISESVYGTLLLVPALVIAGVSVPLGTIGDRVGKARAVKIGLGLCAFSMWTLIFIRSELALVLGGSLIGVGFVIAFPAWMAYISSSCPPAQRGAIMGSVGTVQGIGAMLGAPLGGYLYEHAHIRVSFLPWISSHYAPFLGTAFLLLVSWFLALLTLKEPQDFAEENG